MNKKVILVVDDEPRSRQGIRKTIERLAFDQYEVITAENAAEALNRIDNEKVHVLITDIRMPEVSGLELLKQLKEKAQDPVVIVISAYSEFEYAHEALELGVVNYLLKPIAKEKLMDAIEKAVDIEKQREKTGMFNKILDDKLIEMQELTKYNRAVQQAIEYIDMHFEQELTLKEVANQVHLNPSYLSALFKEELQITFSEYVTRKRIQEAKKLLLSTDLTVSEIAEKSGYQTSKYFIKLFKQFENTTPNGFRKQNVSDS
ncbi:two-component response regulator [Gracilibacillus boraciitolerans JCM 21714]|uniref:Two-component response regulator n=1 Tax=Gracilibacillus boraciitolerans JCM 21714 TaxID=1298598 RepID=W4VGB3_9BACI|nr:response regulator [Gracilibacillus boraciitolerans]GAE92206.1 two-component response regulator [Gracilibacillus boraciitolerans JCM 21714]